MKDAQEISGEIVVDERGQPNRRQVEKVEDAKHLIKRLINDAEERNKKNAQVQRKLDDDPPYKVKELEAAGQAWRSNRPTGFLSGYLSRAIAAYKKPIDEARFLTYSALTGEDGTSIKKSNTFRREITRVIRQWCEWDQYLEGVLYEFIAYGYAVDVYFDEITWRPNFLRYDEVYLPSGVKQTPSDVPFFAVTRQYYPHELVLHLRDPQSAEMAGWNLDAIVKAINSADDANASDGEGSPERRYQDAFREWSMPEAYKGGVKAVNATHLYVKELSGKVSHYIVNDDSDDMLFELPDRFDSMEECLRMFTLQVGNGKFYGSKGLGRILYNSASVADKARNGVVDQLYLSGLRTIEGNGDQIKSKLVIHYPFVVLPEGTKLQAGGFEVDVEAFKAVDTHISEIAERQIGVFLPSLKQEGPVRTASEVNYGAAIEQSMKEANIRRFFASLLKTVFQVQIRICSPEYITKGKEIFEAKNRENGLIGKILSVLRIVLRSDKDVGELVEKEKIYGTEVEEEIAAIDAIVNMLEGGLTVQDIVKLAHTSTVQALEEMFDEKAAIMNNLAAKYAGSPFVDQRKLVHKDISSALGEEEADDLVLPDNDPVVESEQARQQLLENSVLLSGGQVPVSPRDSHLIHLNVMFSQMSPLIEQFDQSAATAEIGLIYQAVRDHGMTHIELAQQDGTPDEQLAPMRDMFKRIDKIVGIAGSEVDQAGRAPVSSAPRFAGRGGHVDPASAVTSAETGQPQAEDIAGIVAKKPLSRGLPDDRVAL